MHVPFLPWKTSINQKGGLPTCKNWRGLPKTDTAAISPAPRVRFSCLFGGTGPFGVRLKGLEMSRNKTKHFSKVIGNAYMILEALFLEQPPMYASSNFRIQPALPVWKGCQQKAVRGQSSSRQQGRVFVLPCPNVVGQQPEEQHTMHGKARRHQLC